LLHLRFMPAQSPASDLRDLLARVQTLQVERDQLATLLRERDSDRKDFFATLAHEMRNPLAAIRSAAHVLRMADNDQALTRAARSMIERQVTQLARLIEDLTDVAQGPLELACERVTLEALLHQAIDANRAVLDSRQQPLRLELPPLPLWLNVDQHRMVQVFAGILDNGSKFSDRGAQIRIRALCDQNQLTVTFTDQGVGIAADRLPEVFDRFTRNSHADRDGPVGLGVGMTLARRLVEMHGGRIFAHSAGPGCGSRFEVQLNLAPPLPSPVPPAVPETLATASLRRGARVLVVDDNHDSAQGLALMLDLEGHEVRTAADGMEALDIAEQFRPQVVLLDIGMPGIDGYETARRLRARPWARSVLLCAQTGWGQEEDKRRARSAGFDRHLVKPVDPEEVTRIVAEACRSAALGASQARPPEGIVHFLQVDA
jgi:CheY-like chemotaxis protein